MRLLLSEHQIPSPSEKDRLSIETFAGLMYNRAHKVEAALEQFGIDYELAAQAALDELMPGMQSHLAESVDARRGRMRERLLCVAWLDELESEIPDPWESIRTRSLGRGCWRRDRDAQLSRTISTWTNRSRSF